MTSGRLLIAAAAILWSTSGLFAKAPTFDAWPSQDRVVLMVFWRAAFASLVLLLMVRRIQWSWTMLPMVGFFVAMNWAFINALVYAESTTAIWLQYSAPIFVLAAGVLWFKETVQQKDFWFLATSLCGVLFILGFQIGHTSPRGLAYGVLSGACYAGVILSLRQLRQYDAAWLVFMNHAATALVFLPACWFLSYKPSGIQWVYLAGFGILQMGLPYLIVARSLRKIPGHEASLILLLEPVLVPVWVFLMWRHAPSYEAPGWTTIAGALLILTSLFVHYAAPWLRRGAESRRESAAADDNTEL